MEEHSITLKTGKTLTFRLLYYGDARALQELYTGLSDRSKDFFTPHPFTEEVLEKIIARTVEGKDRGYMLRDGERCVAYCYLWWFNTDFPLLGIGVRDDFQGMGVGRRLMAIMINDAEKAGKAGIELTTELDNSRAKALYESVGFKTAGVVENRDGDGSKVPEYHMYYPFTPGTVPPPRTFGPPV